MRKLIITAGAAVALALAVTGTASASVNVTDQGTGFVGKGDVQNALGLANDAAMQAKFLAGEVKFTSLYTMHASSDWKCGGKDYNTTSDVTYKRPMDVPRTRTTLASSRTAGT